MSRNSRAATGSVLALLLVTTAGADVITDGPAANGSVGGSHLVSPSGSPAGAAVRPSDRSAVTAISPSESRRARAISPNAAQRPSAAVRPREAQAADALDPSEHRATRALHPGETLTREIYNPHRYGGARAETGVIVRSGPATQGSLRQQEPPSIEEAFANTPSRPAHVDLSLGAKGAMPSFVSEQSAAWYRRRVMNRVTFEAMDCGRLKYVDYEGETFRLCHGTWVRRFMWGGETSYVGIYPPTGATLEALPDEYSKVRVGNTTYLVVHVTFYRRVSQPGREMFEVVAPPLGAVVRSIPRFALEIEPGLHQFDSVYYRRTSGGYEIIAPPIEDRSHG